MSPQGCRHENPAGARFCGTCGAALGRACVSCGTLLLPDASFCMSCGVAVAPSVPGGAAAPAVGSEGERRRLTVMFCDLADSTKLAARLDPEVFGEVVDTYYQLCGDAIRQYNGFVANYLGDGLLALFGYPEAAETTAEDAVEAALEIQRSMRALNRAGGARGVEISARIGVHSGLVVVTEIGTPERRETHVLGDAVHVAARVQTLAEVGAVVVTEDVRRKVEGAFRFASLGSPELKGVPEPVELHGVVDRDRLHRTPRGRAGGTSFVGRSSELALLHDRWLAARRGDGQTVLVLGEPGIGKSALLERLRSDVGPDAVWVEVVASRLEQTQPFAVVRNLIERQFDWPPDEPTDRRILDIEAALGRVTDTPDEGVQLVCDLLELPLDDRFPPLLMSPEEQRRRLMGWLVRWISALARPRPIVLVVEDLHWADPSSLEVLASTLDQVASLTGLVVLTARLGFAPPWATRGHHTQITLNRLGAEETRAIVCERLGFAGTPSEVVDALVDRSDGVPLFAEELARAFGESVAEALGSEIPTSLYDSLMARLDRLGPAKAVAQMASAIGREFPFDLLGEVSGYTPEDLVTSLARLDHAELVIVRGFAPTSTYQFRHALVQQAAYDSMLHRNRAQLHRRIAETLTRRVGSGEVVAPELLAHHWSEAGDANEAIEAWRTAAQRAAARSAFAETVAHYEQALALLDQLTQEPERVHRELALQLGLTDALLMVRGFGAPETIAAADRARKLSEYLGDTASRFRTLYNLWGTAMSSGEIMNGQALADELVALADELGDEPSRCEAHTAQAGSLYNRGQLAGALEHARTVCDRPSEALIGILPASGVIQAALYGGAAAALLARLDDAHRLVALMESAEHHPDADPLAQVLAPLSSSVVNVWLRDSAAVRAQCERLEAIGLQFGADILVGWAQIYGGWAEAMAGDPGGVARTSSGLAKHVAARQRLGLNHSLGLLAESQLLSGHLHDALATVADALLLPGLDIQIQHTCELLRLRAQLRAMTGDHDGAISDFEASLAVATDMGAALLQLRVGAAWARLLDSRGDSIGGCAVLAPILARHSEGECLDMREARRLLAELASTAPSAP
jgi:class 3 adenylate cyclase